MQYENILLKGIKIGVILALFTPLVLGRFGLTLSAYPKAVFFRSLIEIIFIFYLLLISLNRKYLPKISLLFLAISIFVGSLILTSFTGVNLHRSFFGDPERAVGVILYLHLFVFFLILISVFREKKEWFKLFKITVIVSGISSLAGILQKLNVFSFYGLSLPQRISGTLSNPDFFAPYMILSIFLAFFLLLIEKRKDFKIIWLVILLLNCFTLTLSGTRGAWTGMMVGIALLLPLWFFYYSRLNQKKRKIILLGILFLSILVFLMALAPEQSGLKKNYFFNRFISIFEFSIGSRGEVWKMAFEAFKEKPIFGWGPESFSYIFDKNFEARYLLYIPEWMYFDNPHSKIMNLMATSGLLGTLSYLFVFFVVFYLLFRRNKSWEGFNQKSKNIFSLTLFALFVSYFVQSLFIFDTICIYLIFFLALGFINNNFLLSNEPEKKRALEERKGLPIGSKIVLIFPLIFLSLITFYQVNWKSTKAAISFPRSIGYEKKEPQKAIQGYKEGINKKTIYDKDFRLITVERSLFMLERGLAGNAEKEIVETLIELKPLLEKDLEIPDRRPNDSYEYLARINQRIYLFYRDPAALEEMERVLKKAISFNKEKQEFYRLMGEMRILQGNYNEEEIFFQKMYEFSPRQFKDKTEFYKNLGIGYLKADDMPKAVENFKKALDREYYLRKFTSQPAVKYDEFSFTESVAILYCRDLNDLETCGQIYERAMEIYPEYQDILQKHLNILMEEAAKTDAETKL